MKNRLIIFPFIVGAMLMACKHKKPANYNNAVADGFIIAERDKNHFITHQF